MAAGYGVKIGAINPNVFQDRDYQFGSICHKDERVRKKAIQAPPRPASRSPRPPGPTPSACGSPTAPTTQTRDDFRERKKRMEDSLRQVYKAMPSGMRMLIEYKFFEPAFYHTDIADWGCSILLCQKLGPQAEVLVDTGHHAQGTNLERIVAILLDEGRLGGFHFNSRKYADDDLTVGSINPYELFLIYNELVEGEDEGDAKVKACAKRVAYMFDQCHTHKPTVEAIIQSAVTVQETYAKALLVDRAALKAARANADIVGAEEVLKDAYNTDVRAILKEWRESKGMAQDPLKAFRARRATPASVTASARSGARGPPPPLGRRSARPWAPDSPPEQPARDAQSACLTDSKRRGGLHQAAVVVSAGLPTGPRRHPGRRARHAAQDGA